ncbi:SDR family NAD(P)-dependent oxidoreductase [Mucilaginibacter gotjawali]|uniref:NAD(P)-dependent dehydrogenase (Short-subunit alcohol dehydrogenase family) n=2 Tax=Mucilaginibacter gotjawali TaxID=1550579 RepID=A0A839SLL3_9SPHI|nr:SDR family oxidoreductase [Mucilaginibacter gotjawali]MBB3058432.1 NAD(P)-dependent dehydrogenase (short-subunit alcohol dehydrogenase family) [Mucilaginibacter gotjawali]BAU53740.1 3-oxoacyl-[acyl-carrier-protein] reductase FabG1 [Mucilaginibacter gotjawali]
MNFEGKNILVVGGSSGIGLSLVKMLNANYATVYVISRSEPDNLPVGVKHLQTDITATLDAITGFLPDALHGLVYSVGSINLKPFNRLTEADFLNDYRINVLGAARIIQQSLKQLKNAGSASVVLISSVAAQTGMPYHASIAAAKGAVEGIALSLAAELSVSQIRVNVVAPSLTNTPLAQNLLNTPEKREASAKRHPLAKYGQPEDISNAISFLLSDDSNWITGQVIGIDGGLGKLKTI